MPSAGDVERYVYCAHNWHLSRQGHAGDPGHGVEAHQAAADEMQAAGAHTRRARLGLRASTTILAIAGIATLATLIFVARAEVSDSFVILATALVLLNCSAALLTLALHEQETATRLRWEARGLDPARLRTVVVPIPPDRGQWTLRSVAMAASIAFLAVAGSGVHPLRPVLVALAAVLVATSAAGLGQAAVTTYRARRAATTPGVVPGTVVDLDLDGHGTLLEDPAWGLAGRPDYLLQTPSGLVPVEFKSGHTPDRPHDSHRMQLAAYLRLVETCIGRAAYGLLVYPEGVFRIGWDDTLRRDLHATLVKIQTADAAGKADRDHAHAGKCAGCARRDDCTQAVPAVRMRDATVLAPTVPS